MSSYDSTPEYAFFRSVGGKVITEGDYEGRAKHFLATEGPVIDFGYLHESFRDTLQHATAQSMMEVMPSLEIKGYRAGSENKVCLWEPIQALSSLGYKVPGNFRQVTGSCVGNGFGGADWYTSWMDKIVRRQLEDAATMPFWLWTYGWGRALMGARGRGDGSTGGSQAQAAEKYGVPYVGMEGLPTPDNSDGLCFGESVEMQFSYGPSSPKGLWEAEALKHVYRKTAKCRSSDDVREAIRNYYACTCASMWGGLMKPPVKDGVLLNRKADRWAHQMFLCGWLDHPTLGELFYNMNSWGPRTHGTCPSGAPVGGFWITKADVDYMCADEVIAYSGDREGFLARDLTDFLPIV